MSSTADDPREAAAAYLDRAARHSVRGEVTSAMSQLEFAEQCLRGIGRTGSANVVCDIREGDVCHPSVAYELREIAQFLFVDGAEAYPEVASDGGERE